MSLFEGVAYDAFGLDFIIGECRTTIFSFLIFQRFIADDGCPSEFCLGFLEADVLGHPPFSQASVGCRLSPFTE